MFFAVFEDLTIFHNHSKFSARHGSNTTSDVTAVFWPPILGSTSQLRTAEKSVFAYRMRKKVGSVSK